MYGLARESGVDVRELKNRYPSECRALAEAHATARGAAIEAKRASDLRRVRETIDALHAKGRRPSKWFVERTLADVSLRDPTLYQAWRDRMLELGWLEGGT